MSHPTSGYRSPGDQESQEFPIGYLSNHVPVTSAVICANCKRRPYMGLPLHLVNRGRMVCTDCLCFITGMDPRDPALEATARSGDGFYLTLEEWEAAGEPHVPVPPPGPADPPQPPRDRWQSRPSWWRELLARVFGR